MAEQTGQDGTQDEYQLHLSQRSRQAYRLPYMEPLMRRYPWTHHIPILPGLENSSHESLGKASTAQKETIPI